MLSVETFVALREKLPCATEFCTAFEYSYDIAMFVFCVS